MAVARRIKAYLDNAATTPLCEESSVAMRAFLEPGIDARFGNANSLHSVGRDAFSALEDARMGVCRALGASRPDEIVFTSGATEADNAALVGMAVAAREKARAKGLWRTGGHVVMSRIEHDAVLGSARMLRELGFDVDYVGNDAQGVVSPDALARVMRDDTALVSIMAANNEVGTIQPIRDLARLAHERGALFHTDAVQALGKIAVDMRAWGVDAASFSAHKVCGPKGVGILYLKAATPFTPLLAGGGQERGLRSGTQNVAGIVGAAAAVTRARASFDAYARRTMPARDRLYELMSAHRKVVPSVRVTPSSDGFLPHIVNVCVRGCESQTLIMQLDLLGYCVSGGSACSSNSLDPSHVLSALGVERNLAQGSLRVSFGEDASVEQAEEFFEAFKEVVDRWS